MLILAHENKLNKKAGLYRLVVCIWLFWIEGLVGPHESHKVFAVAQIGYVECVARQYVHGLLQAFLKASSSSLPNVNSTSPVN